MNKILKLIQISLLIILGYFFTQCEDDDNTKYVRPNIEEEITHPNDIFLKDHMFDTYQTAVRWRWDNRFIKPTQQATPIKAEFVIPVTKVVEYLWIGAYESQGEKGKDFMNKLFPSELQYIGSYIFKENGSRLLGYAEGGARITLLNLNSYDLTNRNWLTNPGGGILSTVHHEFSHIVHQKHGLPQGFKGISNYLGNGWLNIDNIEALKMGTVRNYGTLNEYEDFCEIVSHFLTFPKDDFESIYLIPEDCSQLNDPDRIAECREINKGKQMIESKLNLIIDFYKKEFGLDLIAMRDELESRIDYVVENNKIPE